MKFVIIAHQIFPHNSPRAFRAIELAKAIKNEGNDVVVYSVLGKYDYSQFMDKTGIIVKDLGMPRFYRDSSDGTYHKNLLERIIFHFTEKYLSWPSMTLMPKIKRALTAVQTKWECGSPASSEAVNLTS